MDSLVIVSFAVSILLAVYELSGVLKARLSGRTKNTGRVIARFFILVMLMVLLGESVHWYAYISAIELPLAEDIRIRNTPFLICILGLTTIIIFIFVEMWTLFAEKEKRHRREFCLPSHLGGNNTFMSYSDTAQNRNNVGYL